MRVEEVRTRFHNLRMAFGTGYLDPLKIGYVVVQGDDRLDEASPFQGFGSSWPSTLWALRLLVHAPASYLERSMPLNGLMAQRMGGTHRLQWTPLAVSALERLSIEDLAFALVVMTGDQSVAERVDAWGERQPRPVLHVCGDKVGDDEDAVGFCDTTLRHYCRLVLDRHGDTLSAPRLAAARQGLDEWLSRSRVPDPEAPGGHNVTLPNQLVLLRAERDLIEAGVFMGQSEEEYDALAVSSAQSVLALRHAVGFRDYNRLYLPQPGLILTEPALYRFSYAKVRGDDGFATKPMMAALRRLQKQKGLWNTMDGEELAAFAEDPKAQMIIHMRQAELATHAHGVGLAAAQTVSAVVRLRPSVNHVFQILSRFARNVRTEDPAARLKTLRLFDDIQRELAAAVGEDRIDLIRRSGIPMRIVSDAPLELLPVDGLPLALRFDVSRINATPGNLMMGALIGQQPAMYDLATLCKVLIVSAFSDRDRLKDVLRKSVETVLPILAGLVDVTLVRVRTRSELVEALNASDATILVFDGHGDAGDGDGVGGVVIDEEKVDVWSLRGVTRIPPIVVLSACDTHRIDAPTHATVGNGFLAAGAATVLATLVPIEAKAAAQFVVRLLLRLAHYLPAALGTGRRVYNWCEVMAGMLRMTLCTDLVSGFVKDNAERARLGMRVNMHINTEDPNWYEAILDDIALSTGLARSELVKRARRILARSESIRYVQLGSPEAILIDDGAISSQFFSSGIEKELGIV